MPNWELVYPAAYLHLLGEETEAGLGAMIVAEEIEAGLRVVPVVTAGNRKIIFFLKKIMFIVAFNGYKYLVLNIYCRGSREWRSFFFVGRVSCNSQEI